MKAATVVWYDVVHFSELTLVVLAEQSLAHKWQKSAPETGSRCLSEHGGACINPLCLAICIQGESERL